MATVAMYESGKLLGVVTLTICTTSLSNKHEESNYKVAVSTFFVQ